LAIIVIGAVLAPFKLRSCCYNREVFVNQTSGNTSGFWWKVLVGLLVLIYFLLYGTGILHADGPSPSMTGSPQLPSTYSAFGDYDWGPTFYWLPRYDTPKPSIGKAEVRLMSVATEDSSDFVFYAWTMTAERPSEVRLQVWNGDDWSDVGHRATTLLAHESRAPYQLWWDSPRRKGTYYFRAIARDRSDRPEPQFYWQGRPTGHNSPDSTQTPAWELKIVVK
jgi:hypothetical protein